MRVDHHLAGALEPLSNMVKAVAAGQPLSDFRLDMLDEMNGGGRNRGFEVVQEPSDGVSIALGIDQDAVPPVPH